MPASIDELDETLPAYYTLSNKNLIVIARVREETVYFCDQLGTTTTVILLAEPECYALKYVFLNFMIDSGVTVIDLKEEETFDENYQMTKNSLSIIKSLLLEYKYDKIITHPKYSKKNDSQNRAIYDVISKMVSSLGTNNHYTYNKIGINGTPIIPCGIKKDVLVLYCSIINDDDVLDEELYNNYVNITSNISGVRKISEEK
jgi:hypothetical protein